jgi:predicted nucleotidyltransferase
LYKKKRRCRISSPISNLEGLTMAEEKLVENDSILEEMVRRLVAAFNPDHIYLYGSRARGEAGPDSDYDLMLVVSASQVPRYRRDQQAFRALCGLGVPKEVIVLTRAEFEAGRKVTCSLPATVLREGRLLYAA